MRLWHYKLLSYLPDSQIVAQWRELNSIFKKQDKHILINYVYDYPKEHLWHYSVAVKNEMVARGFKIRSFDNFDAYFDEVTHGEKILYYPEHNNRYLLQCFMNLQEKYDRGQKDFSKERYEAMERFVEQEIADSPNGMAREFDSRQV